MSYKLLFHPKALKEWEKLDKSIKEQLKKKLKERLQNPKIPSAKLSGFNNVYKIKLRSSGYRLVYQVKDNELIVLVLVVNKREDNIVYELLAKRY